MSNNTELKTYAVTGVIHGSIVTAINKEYAMNMFKRYYDGEEIMIVKDISNCELKNL